MAKSPRTAANEAKMRPVYDFSKGVRGRYAKHFAEGTNVALVDSDLTKVSPDHVVSSGNVFADLGLPEAEDLLAKSNLAHHVTTIITNRHISPAEAAHLLGTTEPKVSDLLRGRLGGFSIERLIRFLNALDQRGRLPAEAPARVPAAHPRATSPTAASRKRKT